ncbi:MAG: hypothetical protein NT116_06365 [Candidatus Parcubacteria bacterium]|nr:hypothetical protein [Candidatus Parcubacteria bacterium]
MIYLIGGAPRCGKTILAKKIAATKKIGWISTDNLWEVVFYSTPKSQRRAKFPFHFAPKPKNKYHFEVYSPEEHWRMDMTESDSIWPGVKALIEHLINCRHDYVIEGVNLLPRLVNQLKNTRYWKNIRVVYLVKTDLNQIKEGIPKNKEHDWILEGGIDVAGRLDKAAAMIQFESRYMEKEAKKYHFKVVNTGSDFNKKINKNLI